MKEYRYSKMRTYSLIVFLFLLLAIINAVFLFFDTTKMFLIVLGFSFVLLFFFSFRRISKNRRYKVIISESALIYHDPISGGIFETVIPWQEVKNITFDSYNPPGIVISVNSVDNKHAVIPLSSFSHHKDMLKAIIRRSCDNLGFFADQKILNILRNE